MSYLNQPPKPPGRPRDVEREREILRVVLSILAESGVEGLSFEEVARRAKASKPTLYRRWATKQEMIVAAIKAGPAAGNTAEFVSTGSIRADLLALLDRLEATMEAGSSISFTILQAGLRDPDLCDHIENSSGPTGARLPEAILRGAIERGELPASADPFAFEETAAAALLIRKLNGLATGAAYRETLVDAVLLPALRSGVIAGQHGIFSGKPTPSNLE